MTTHRPALLFASVLLMLPLSGAMAQSAGPDRFVGTYAGIEAGYGRGTARRTTTMTTTGPMACDVGGTVFPLGTGTFLQPGSFLIIGNVGQLVPADRFGLVPVGPGFDLPRQTPDGQPFTVPVIPLGYGLGGIIALEDGRDTIVQTTSTNGTPGAINVPNPFDCGILVQDNPTLPTGTVALDFGGGTTLLPPGTLDAPGYDLGTFVTATGATTAVGSSSLSGGTLGVFVGHNWSLGGPIAGGVEARLMGANLKTGDGGVKLRGLAIVAGRVGIVQDRAFFYVSGGVAAARVKAGAGSGTGTGFAIGSGIEVALDDRTGLRFDVTHVDLGNDTFGGRIADVSFTLASLGVTFRF